MIWSKIRDDFELQILDPQNTAIATHVYYLVYLENIFSYCVQRYQNRSVQSHLVQALRIKKFDVAEIFKNINPI